jgi:hypothetical protein
MLTATYAECHTQTLITEYSFAECHYAKCRHAECIGLINITLGRKCKLIPQKFLLLRALLGQLLFLPLFFHKINEISSSCTIKLFTAVINDCKPVLFQRQILSP